MQHFHTFDQIYQTGCIRLVIKLRKGYLRKEMDIYQTWNYSRDIGLLFLPSFPVQILCVGTIVLILRYFPGRQFLIMHIGMCLCVITCLLFALLRSYTMVCF